MLSVFFFSYILRSDGENSAAVKMGVRRAKLLAAVPSCTPTSSTAAPMIRLLGGIRWSQAAP